MMLRLPLLIVVLCRYVSATNECAMCDCCNNGATRCGRNATAGVDNYCFDGCIEGYYGNTCLHQCYSTCTTCSTQNYCTGCIDGKYLVIQGQDQFCSSCRKVCTACTSSRYCTGCNDGHYLYKQGHYQYCSSCGRDCATCTSYNYCTQCNDGYYLDIHGNYQYCSNCQGGCTACTSYNYCTNCEMGKYGSICQYACGRGCIDYQCDIHNGTCTCISNNFQGSKCDTCVDGKYGTNCDQTCHVGCAGSTCQESDGSCYSCRKRFTGDMCDTCVDGTYGVSCNSNCPDSCLSCMNNYTCSECKRGYWGPVCIAICQNNCKGSICDHTSGTCLTCIDGYHGDTCTDECPSNCLTCTAPQHCTSCKTGYTGTACQYLCTNCKPGIGCGKSDGICEECKYGFYGYSCGNPCKSQCKSCERDTGNRCTECPDGKYGKSSSTVTYLACNTDCSSNCLSVTCDGITGSCDHGCMSGYWGSQCEHPCPENCKSTVCFDSNGTCASGCQEGFTGPQCNCPVNCECHADGTCYQCKDSFANTAKECECSADLCSDQLCTSCYNASFYLENAACCQCRRNCKNIECVSESQCRTGCKEGYRGNGCSAQCKDVDAMCSRCTTDFSQTTGECLECMSGHYPDNTNKHCIPCSVDCLDDMCDTTDGRCTGGCKSKRWGEKCQSSCGMKCLQCMQSSGTCIVCEGGKYLSDCMEACSTRCNTTTGVMLCAIGDGACLNGCDTVEGSSCVQAIEGSDSAAAIGASVGVLLLVLIIAGVIVAVILLRRRKARNKDESCDMHQDNLNDTTVTHSDVAINRLPDSDYEKLNVAAEPASIYLSIDVRDTVNQPSAPSADARPPVVSGRSTNISDAGRQSVEGIIEVEGELGESCRVGLPRVSGMTDPEGDAYYNTADDVRNTYYNTAADVKNVYYNTADAML